MTVFLVSVGGIFGVLLRFFIAYLMPISSFWSIIFINAVGSFIIGCLFKAFDTQMWMFAAIGFCGAFTTFSTYSLETVRLLASGEFRQAIIYVLLMNLLSVLSCWIGFKLVQI